MEGNNIQLTQEEINLVIATRKANDEKIIAAQQKQKTFLKKYDVFKPLLTEIQCEEVELKKIILVSKKKMLELQNKKESLIDDFRKHCIHNMKNDGCIYCYYYIDGY